VAACDFARAPQPAEEEPAARSEEVLARCSITDLPEFAERCQTSRRALGLSTTRWAAPCLLAAIQLALRRGWPADQIQPALLTLAADRETRSPMRLAEAGPWWDQPPPPPPELDGVDLTALEAELDEVAGQRPALQAKARAELAAERLPVTRATVTAARRPDPRPLPTGRRMTQPHSPSPAGRTTPRGHPSKDPVTITDPTWAAEQDMRSLDERGRRRRIGRHDRGSGADPGHPRERATS
jgi:hypothetical protein